MQRMQSVLLTGHSQVSGQAAFLLAYAHFSSSRSCQEQPATHSLKPECCVLLQLYTILYNAIQESRGGVYRVANSVEVLGACRQVSHQCIVEDACMQGRRASVISSNSRHRGMQMAN